MPSTNTALKTLETLKWVRLVCTAAIPRALGRSTACLFPCRCWQTTSFSLPTEDSSVAMPRARAMQKMQNTRSVYAVYLTFEWEVSWDLGPRRVFEGSPERLQGSPGPPCLTLRCRFLASCIRKNSSLATLSFAPGQILLQLERTHRHFAAITGLSPWRHRGPPLLYWPLSFQPWSWH